MNFDIPAPLWELAAQASVAALVLVVFVTVTGYALLYALWWIEDRLIVAAKRMFATDKDLGLTDSSD